MEYSEQERLEYWAALNVYDDENQPSSKMEYVTYCVWFPYRLPHPQPYSKSIPYMLWIDVDDETNIATVADKSKWFGKLAGDMTWEQREKIYEFLYEFEFIKKVRTGPEDYEWFATEKLTANG